LGVSEAATPDAAAFKAFEAGAWTDRPPTYHRLTGQITARLVEPLLEAAGVRPGLRVVDVACGPGDLTAAAAARGAETVGVDLAAGMLEVARERHPGLTFREGDAEALPFPDASFDAVVVGFVVNRLVRPERGLAEMARRHPRRAARPRARPE
jgi:ubiquinone/menaquinone biosynthesis C-methylase UbiE